MSWPVLGALEAINLVRAGAPALDVRSPSEFNDGCFPGFRNVAILNDDHRHQVGLTYKKLGNSRAVELGHRLVDPIRDVLVESWRSALGGREGLVACWRGGLRSEIAASWLLDVGVLGARVDGGYKAMRRLVLEEFDRPRSWIVLGGLTGSGKSELIRCLSSEEIGVLDLEALAIHRGSAFGGFLCRAQPAQQTFENAIGLRLIGSDAPLLVENESAMIGRCAVPPQLRAAYARAPLVRLTATKDERIMRIFGEYVTDPLKTHSQEVVHEFLSASLARISKALGGVRSVRLKEMMKAAFSSPGGIEAHRPWIECLLNEYYDPMYEYGIKHDERKLLFEGDHAAVRQFLAHSFNRWRS